MQGTGGSVSSTDKADRPVASRKGLNNDSYEKTRIKVHDGAIAALKKAGLAAEGGQPFGKTINTPDFFGKANAAETSSAAPSFQHSTPTGTKEAPEPKLATSNVHPLPNIPMKTGAKVTPMSSAIERRMAKNESKGGGEKSGSATPGGIKHVPDMKSTLGMLFNKMSGQQKPTGAAGLRGMGGKRAHFKGPNIGGTKGSSGPSGKIATKGITERSPLRSM